MSTLSEQARQIPIAAEYDILVAGGGPAGIGAAIAAARSGAKTLCVEWFGCLGGMMTSGLHTHVCILKSAGGGEDFIIGGIPMELCRRGEEKRYGEIVGSNYDYEPEAMKRDLDDWAEEVGLDLLYHSFVADAIVENGVGGTGVPPVIKGLIVENKSGRQAILAKQVVDCTGDADVAARAGAPYEYGRPSDGLTQPCTLMFRLENVDWEKVNEYRQDDPGLTKMCAQAIEHGDMEPFQTQLMGFWYTKYRPTQMGVNFTNITRCNATNAQDITAATIEGRHQAAVLVEVFRKRIPGMESCYMIDTAQYLGVRETRRIVGEYTLTVDDVVNVRKFEDGIAKGSFFVDIHSPNETGLFEPRHLPKGEHYDIPYGCIVPQGIDNLLVAGRCISATHEALGSTRVMFQCMALGEAAGTAAAMCASDGSPPRTIDVPALRAKLSAASAIV